MALSNNSEEEEMKKYYLIVISLILLCNNYSLLAQQEKPIIIHPIIGEKLDKVENDYFKLFPAFDGFREAEFYLNPDSTLKAFVVYKSNGVIKDTLLQKYPTLDRLRNYIDQKLITEINNTQNINRGKYVNTLSSNDVVTTGELLSIRESSFLLLNMGEETYYDKNNSSFDITHIQLADVNKVTAIEKTNIARYVYPLVTGLTAVLIYNSVSKSTSTFETLGSDLLKNALSGVLAVGLGCLVGYVLSIALPIWSVSETEYTAIFNEDDIKGLRYLARYKDAEPFYLQQIK